MKSFGSSENNGIKAAASLCKNLFPNGGSLTSDKLFSGQLSCKKPLSENLNPIEEEKSFGADDDFLRRNRPPFTGFDQDNVIVPKTKQR